MNRLFIVCITSIFRIQDQFLLMIHFDMVWYLLFQMCHRLGFVDFSQFFADFCSPLSNAFCRCLLFQFSVLEMLSTQSSLRLSKGRTLGNGNRLAEMVT